MHPSSSSSSSLFEDKGQLPVSKYLFNGVLYNHETHRVCLVPKVISKLRNDTFTSLTFVELEAAVGRLMCSSAVLGVIMPKYHFAIKVAQRRINLLNRVPNIGHRKVDLPFKIRAMSGQWRNELATNIPRKPLPHSDFA